MIAAYASARSEKRVPGLIVDRTRIPTFAKLAAYPVEATASVAKAGSAGEGRSEKIMRNENVPVYSP